jgi:hypothetical protein
VIIDEAGMADTLTLDTVVDFIVARGASVRLVGDDQQLAAIGAGGVLRDSELAEGTFRRSPGRPSPMAPCRARAPLTRPRRGNR